MSRILVTGINSPLGQAVGRKLQAEGHSVVGTVRSSKIAMQGLPANDLVALDLEDKYSFTNIVGNFHGLVHIASSNTQDTEKSLLSIALGTLYLCNRINQLGIPRLIHLSSMSVYGTPSAEIVDENTCFQHSTTWGATKWAAERIIDNERSSLEAVSIRSPAIAGPNANRHFLAKISLDMMKGLESISVSNPEHLFNNIVHENVIADFIHLLLESDSLPRYRAVPIGSSDPMPLHQIIDLLAKATDYKGRVKWVEPKTPPFRIDSTGAIELGYKPITTVETINRWMNDIKF